VRTGRGGFGKKFATGDCLDGIKISRENSDLAQQLIKRGVVLPMDGPRSGIEEEVWVEKAADGKRRQSRTSMNA